MEPHKNDQGKVRGSCNRRPRSLPLAHLIDQGKAGHCPRTRWGRPPLVNTRKEKCEEATCYPGSLPLETPRNPSWGFLGLLGGCLRRSRGVLDFHVISAHPGTTHQVKSRELPYALLTPGELPVRVAGPAGLLILLHAQPPPCPAGEPSSRGYRKRESSGPHPYQEPHRTRTCKHPPGPPRWEYAQ